MSWRSVPEVGTVLGLRLVAGTLRLFGRRAAAGLLWVVCWYYLAFSRTAREASRDFLARVGVAPSPRAVHRHLWTFARAALDRLRFLVGRVDDVTVHLHGHELVMEEARAKRGALLVGAHLGSFEAMRALSARYEVPLLVLADFHNAKKINGLLEQLSPGLRVRLLELDAGDPLGLLAVKEAIDRGELVAVLADRRTDRPGRDVTVPFLGADARWPAGPWVLAHVLQCPVYFVCALFEPPATYQVHCVPLAERVALPRGRRDEAVAREARRYVEVLEGFVRRAPWNWFNFFPFWEPR